MPRTRHRTNSLDSGYMDTSILFQQNTEEESDCACDYENEDNHGDECEEKDDNVSVTNDTEEPSKEIVVDEVLNHYCETLVDYYGIEHNAREVQDLIVSSVTYITPIMRQAFVYTYNVSSIYLFWIFVHYISAHAYIEYCVPKHFIGFLVSPFLIAAPHCRALRWVIQYGGSTIDNMWIVFGTWVCSHLITRHVKPE